MRLLDLHDRKSREGRSQQRRAPVVQPRGNQIQQKNRPHVGQRGKLPAKQFQLPVVRLTDEFCRVADEEHRQSAINEEGKAAIVRVQCGGSSIEIIVQAKPALLFWRAGFDDEVFFQAFMRAQVSQYAGQEGFVGVLVL